MTGINPEALAAWQAAVGRTEVRREVLEAESLRRYALAVDADPAVEAVPPPLAHWAFFLPQPRDADIGPDGHMRRGGFIPAITLPRRMFAAGAMQFEAPLELGMAAEQVSTIAEVNHKRGRSGDLVFVEIDKVLSQGGTVRVRERQSFVYRDLGDPVAMPVAGEVVPEGEIWQPTAAQLFRFSAVTFNSHRIHYDADYVRDEEGYPALVVHGPLTAAKLAGLAGRGGALRAFAFRAQAPLFLGQAIALQHQGGGVQESEVRAVRCDGATAMTASFECC